MKLIVIGTAEELKKLTHEHEKAELERVRNSLKVLSADDAEKRFEELTLQCETALHFLEDLYANYSEDPFEEWDVAKKKADELEKAELDFSRLIKRWENQRARVVHERAGKLTPS